MISVVLHKKQKTTNFHEPVDAEQWLANTHTSHQERVTKKQSIETVRHDERFWDSVSVFLFVCGDFIKKKKSLDVQSR